MTSGPGQEREGLTDSAAAAWVFKAKSQGAVSGHDRDMSDFYEDPWALLSP